LGDIATILLYALTIDFLQVKFIYLTDGCICMADENSGQSGSSIGQQVADAQAPSQPGEGGQSEYTQIANIISDLDRRLRILEERYSNLRKKIQLTDSNLIDSERSFSKELRTFNDELLELKRSTSDFGDKMMLFSGEMDNTAKKTDLKVLEKYLAMWDPKMFVTRKDLKAYLQSKNITLVEDSSDDEVEDDQ
jgi:hypothetical protein